MPTLVPQQNVTDFVNIVKYVNLYEAGRIPDLLVYYTDIPKIIGRQLIEYSTNGAYLKQCMDIFDDTELQNAGIYYNKSTITPSGPVLIINSTDVTVNVLTSTPGLTILGGSSINKITTNQYALMTNLYIGAGSKVTIIDATAEWSFISLVMVDFQKNSIATLQRVIVGSNIGQVRVTPGANYGGIGYDNTGTCANPVTNMASSNITNNSITITWETPAAVYIGLNIRFKKSDEPTWTTATTQNGDFTGDVGFVFRGLDADTNYDFSVIVTCANGGLSDSANKTEKTECCIV